MLPIILKYHQDLHVDCDLATNTFIKTPET